MNEEAREAVAKATVTLESLGGPTVLVDQTDRYTIHAGVCQRRLQRFLDEIGPPGPLAFDPFKRFLTMRGHTFEADFVGSMGGDHWLWAWANAYLPLNEASTAVSRSVQESGMSIATAGGIVMGDLDPMWVMHRIGGLTLGLTGADAYYVANGSQLYVVAAGQLTLDVDPMDLWGAINDALFSPPANPAAAIRFAAEQQGIACATTEQGLELTHGKRRIQVELDGGRIAGVEADL